MQGFSGKILPAGLEIFAENRRLDLAFPSNPGITFAPRTEMTAWCGSLKGAKMEVNENRGWLGRKNFREKSVKKESPKGKRHHRKREKGKPLQRKYDCFPIRQDLSSRATTIILPGLPAVGDGLFHLWANGHTRLSASGSKEQRKRKIIWKTVKAPLRHKHKRNGPCLISLNCRLGVRQSSFLRLCSSRHTFVQNPFGRWCADE